MILSTDDSLIISLSALHICVLQTECDLEKGLEMRKRVLAAILVTEETYLSHLEALLLVRTCKPKILRVHRDHSVPPLMPPLSMTYSL